MNKKFILLLSLFIVLASCRDADEVTDNDTINANELARQSSVVDEKTTSKNNFDTPPDNTSKDNIEEDPPVKHGGHWKNAN